MNTTPEPFDFVPTPGETTILSEMREPPTSDGNCVDSNLEEQVVEEQLVASQPPQVSEDSVTIVLDQPKQISANHHSTAKGGEEKHVATLKTISPRLSLDSKMVEVQKKKEYPEIPVPLPIPINSGNVTGR